MKQTKLAKDPAPPTTKRDILHDLDQASKIPQSALVEAYPSDPILQYVITPVFQNYYTYV